MSLKYESSIQKDLGTRGNLILNYEEIENDGFDLFNQYSVRMTPKLEAKRLFLFQQGSMEHEDDDFDLFNQKPVRFKIASDCKLKWSVIDCIPSFSCFFSLESAFLLFFKQSQPHLK
jgi:hypothetical protein